jgi:DNA-binding LytR/AlgR family response regulator
MMRCMIIDDEPLSRDILRNYFAKEENLELVAECPDAAGANRILTRLHIDLIFLDIHMPGLSGISFARSLVSAPLIIFATAYPQYAVEGFELNAVDYLVKPFSFERFQKSILRARERIRESSESNKKSPGKVVVRADKKIYALAFDQIRFVESKGDYIQIHLEDGRLLVHSTLKNFLEALPGEEFMRVQKSFLVNLARIEYMEGNLLRLGDHSIPVSPALREELLRRFSSL